MNNTKQANTNASAGPNLQALGLKSPMEVIDLLAMLKIDGEPIIKDDSALLDPKVKAQAVIQFFAERFNRKPNDLLYIASIIKQDLKAGRIKWGH